MVEPGRVYAAGQGNWFAFCGSGGGLGFGLNAIPKDEGQVLPQNGDEIPIGVECLGICGEGRRLVVDLFTGAGGVPSRFAV